jgi:hypothetical protein
LLCVISPGWEHIQPGIHNPLLALFGAHAENDMVINGESTHIEARPITEGIAETMAKNAVNLRVPPKTALVNAGDRTVLAAFPFRNGRVVLAAFGQWFLPDPDIPKTKESVASWQGI